MEAVVLVRSVVVLRDDLYTIYSLVEKKSSHMYYIILVILKQTSIIEFT